MHKTLYGQQQSVYVTANVADSSDQVRRNTFGRVYRFVVSVVLATAVVSCNTIPKREEGISQIATCVNNCLDQDRDPEPVDCAAAEEGVEFYPIPVWDFNSNASNLYGYSDGSVDFFRAITERNPETGELMRDESQGVRILGFEPGVRNDVARCIGEDPTAQGVLHVQGGPFRAWGGAVGRHLKCMNNDGGNVYSSDQFSITYPEGETPDALNKGCGATNGFACLDPEDTLAYSACPLRDRLPDEQKPQNERFMFGMALDLTQWDGVSFWARRSNDSQVGVRLALGDKHTDDDLSYLQYHLNPGEPRFCERNQECGCPGGKECVNGACYDPRYQPPPLESELSVEQSFIDGSEHPKLNEENVEGYSPCGQSMCQRGFRAFRTTDGTNPREDVAFFGTQCTPFTFRGGITDDFCYDPNGELPYENTHVCGDHWLKSVHLSTEWQFFKVPFTDLIQQGWAKEAYSLDLTSSAVVRFIWGRGWIDMMLDDVRFYRNKYTKD